MGSNPIAGSIHFQRFTPFRRPLRPVCADYHRHFRPSHFAARRRDSPDREGQETRQDGRWRVQVGWGRLLLSPRSTSVTQRLPARSTKGIPVASRPAPANESDVLHIRPVLNVALERYPELPFGGVILDATHDAEELHRDLYTTLRLLPVILRRPLHGT